MRSKNTQYFIEMEKRNPGTVAILTHTPERKALKGEWDQKKLNVVLTSNEISMTS